MPYWAQQGLGGVLHEHFAFIFWYVYCGHCNKLFDLVIHVLTVESAADFSYEDSQLNVTL